jgi:DNA primase
MMDILDRCNISVNRAGFCECVFHDGDRTPSMKIYEKSYYCFANNAGGDIINFVPKYHNLSFQDACRWISGEDLTLQTKAEFELAKIRRNEREAKKKKLKAELDEVNKELTGLWDKICNLEPLSDEWTDTYNK